MGAAFVALLAVSILAGLLRLLLETLLSTWWLLPAIAVVAVTGAWAYTKARNVEARAAARRLASLRYTLEEVDALSPTDFEIAVQNLMTRDGFTARHVGGRGDNAADVIAEHLPTRQTVVVQCKHTIAGNNVGPKVIREVHGTAGPTHHAHVAVVVTNGGFTRDAQRQAADFRMALIDRGTLARWATDGTSLANMLALDKAVRGRRYRLRNRRARTRATRVR